jgi:predicted dehydrogenase
MTNEENAIQKKLEVIIISEQDIRADNREYNPYEWDRTIDRFASKSQVTFYKRVNSPNSYKEYYAKYETEEGLRFFKEVSYSSTMTSNGFSKIELRPTNGIIEVWTNREWLTPRGWEYGVIENNEKGRKAVVKLCNEFTNLIFTNTI